MKHIVRSIQRHLSLDLLTPQWRKLSRPADHPTKGHCYVATEALYHVWGRQRGYRPMVLRTGRNKTHWYLRHPESGKIADPTAEQFQRPVAYERGRWCGFLTGNKPSRRCLTVLRRMKKPRAARAKRTTTFRVGEEIWVQREY
jgi:hypothetical protein